MTTLQQLADQFDTFIQSTPEQRARWMEPTPAHPRYSRVPSWCAMIGMGIAIITGVGGMIVVMTAFALSLI